MPFPTNLPVSFSFSIEQWMVLMSIDSVEGKLDYIQEQTMNAEVIKKLSNLLIKKESIEGLFNPIDLKLIDENQERLGKGIAMIYRYNSERIRYLYNMMTMINLTIINLNSFTNVNYIHKHINKEELIINIKKLYEAIYVINYADYSYFLEESNFLDKEHINLKDNNIETYNSFKENFLFLVKTYVMNHNFISLPSNNEFMLYVYHKLTGSVLTVDVNGFCKHISDSVIKKHASMLVEGRRIISGHEIALCMYFLQETHSSIKEYIQLHDNIELCAKIRWSIIERNKSFNELSNFYKKEFEENNQNNQTLRYALTLVDACKFNLFKMHKAYVHIRHVASSEIEDGRMTEGLSRADRADKRRTLAARDYIHAITLFGYVLNGCLDIPFLSEDISHHNEPSYYFVYGFISLAISGLLDNDSILKLIDDFDRVSDYFTCLSLKKNTQKMDTSPIVSEKGFFSSVSSSPSVLFKEPRVTPSIEQAVASSSKVVELVSSSEATSIYLGTQTVLFADRPPSKANLATELLFLDQMVPT